MKPKKILDKIPQITILLLLLFNSNSNGYFRAPYSSLVLFFLILTLYFMTGKKFYLSRRMVFILMVWTLYNIVYLLIYSMFSIDSYFFMIVIFFIVHFTLLLNKERLIYNISRVILYLATISLIFYLIQIVSFSLAWNIVHPIERIFRINTQMFQGLYRYANIFIYTLSDYPSGVLGLNRNFGFMWEPGGFATVLLIGFFSHLFVNQFKLQSKESLIYLLAIFTTFSTTGYLGLILIILYISVRNAYLNIKTILGIMLSLVVVFYIFGSSIVYDKIIFAYEQGLVLGETEQAESIGTAGRFGGLFINLKEFSERPILGHYFDKTDRITNEGTASINGLSNILARFGLFGFIFLIIGYRKSSKLLFREEGLARWVFFTILLICGFAFSLIRGPFFMIFFLYGFLYEQTMIKQTKITRTVNSTLR